jgi:hypothetical protein
MHGKALLLIALGLGVITLLMGFSSANAVFDFDSLASAYGAQNVQPIQNLYGVLSSTGLTSLQIQLLLAQAIHETGLFTGSPNWKNVGNNNMAGITAHGSFPADSGGVYAVYPDLNSFVNDWLSPAVLDKGYYPLNATNVQDFATRLKNNGYYGDSLANYSADLQKWYNVLQSAQLQTA